MAEELVIRPVKDAGEYPRLVTVWRTAVEATHGFLALEHREAIAARLEAEFLPSVTLIVAEHDRRSVGFAGTADGKLEMLFVDAGHRGGGIGSKLLQQAIVTDDVTTVDVNEQNELTLGFYERAGFAVSGRSPVDGDGLPYPILHMELKQSGTGC
ncbi:GNAT family N-acetyltransferase [Brevibacterium sp.]|uniref:GNAT family N-acetyltransferase n=1 Tax=Brevibacterium sp. TaxID=1701 RepID=UPI002810FFB3|nr:GNAT family N-acetyltransferase [Brevibacterium sp.]